MGFACLGLLGGRKTCWVGLKSGVCKVVFVKWCLRSRVRFASSVCSIMFAGLIFLVLVYWDGEGGRLLGFFLGWD